MNSNPDPTEPIIIAEPEPVMTPEELEAERLAQEARKNKRKNNPDAPPVVTPPAPTEPEVTDNDITSIRDATPDDPNGETEIIIDNNVGLQSPESDSEASLNKEV